MDNVRVRRVVLASLRSGLVFVLLSAAAGCGPQTTTPTAAPAASATPAATPALDFASCGGYGLSQAAEILGVPVTSVADQSAQQSWGKDCVFVSTGDGIADSMVSFTLSREDTADAAQESFAQLRGNAGIADNVIAGEGQSHAVEGLGDEALWVRASTSLYVRSGPTTITVTMPNDEARQTAVAHQLLH